LKLCRRFSIDDLRSPTRNFVHILLSWDLIARVRFGFNGENFKGLRLGGWYNFKRLCDDGYRAFYFDFGACRDFMNFVGYCGFCWGLDSGFWSFVDC
jgi:hypothetical protein